MFGKKGYLLAAGLFLILAFLTGRARLRLDDMTAHFRDDFQEMMYLPRGDALKIIACGFDAPLADALFVRGVIYTAEFFTVQGDKNSQRKYTYDLFDVITDLSPRFARAYQLGALLLSAAESLQSNLDGCALLEKGSALCEEEEIKGHPLEPDPRWMLHTIAANIYESSVQVKRRRRGDAEGAAEARRQASREFRLAAASPNSPPYIRDAAEGYASVFDGGADIEKSRRAVLLVLRELHDQAERRGDADVRDDLGKRIDAEEKYILNIRLTREIEALLSRLGKQYLNDRGAPPASANDLLAANLIPGLPRTPLDDDEGEDAWLALPDGEFRSKKLADLETQNHIDVIQSAFIDYRRENGGAPQAMEMLVEKGYLADMPKPPLRLLGQRYEISGGAIRNVMPEPRPAPMYPEGG